jgi:hypothetical protein
VSEAVANKDGVTSRKPESQRWQLRVGDSTAKPLNKWSANVEEIVLAKSGEEEVKKLPCSEAVGVQQGAGVLGGHRDTVTNCKEGIGRVWSRD